MNIAFVGINRDYLAMEPDYIDTFNKFHYEMPWYYADFGGNKCFIVSEKYSSFPKFFTSGGLLQNINENQFREDDYDIIVHWRQWYKNLHKENSLNIMTTCDFSYGNEWKEDVTVAFNSGKLKYVLAHQAWHTRQVISESGLPKEIFLNDMAQGVDVDVFKPSEDKDPYQMLWASDPGRGLAHALQLVIGLYQLDKRFRLHVCCPDYARFGQTIGHESIKYHGKLPAGDKLFNLFNTTGVFPYTSTFPEPSSRAHRQAQSAGAMVVYPTNMGSPSETIHDNSDGVLINGQTINWRNIIINKIRTGDWERIGKNAREFALTQSWEIQSKNFNKFFEDKV